MVWCVYCYGVLCGSGYICRGDMFLGACVVMVTWCDTCIVLVVFCVVVVRFVVVVVVVAVAKHLSVCVCVL